MATVDTGWFVIPGKQQGTRTLESQTKGLEGIDFRDKTVLDVGCAEGLISKYVLDRGALRVRGAEIIQSRVDAAVAMCDPNKSEFWRMNVQDLPLRHILQPGALIHYDIILLLSILHKLPNPASVLAYCGGKGNKLVIRLPKKLLRYKHDPLQSLNVVKFLTPIFELVAEPETSIEPVSGQPEWLGIFERRMFSHDDTR